MEAPRTAEVNRDTQETQIKINLGLDGTGQGEIATGIPFLDHMLTLFSRHGFFDLSIKAEGDIQVDYHHLVEDMGISLGQAFALDLSNRGYLVFEADLSVSLVRDFNVQLFKEFFQAFANEVACNLHIRLEHGDEPHHVAEAIFKGFAKSLDIATQIEPRLEGRIPSTKGTLSS